MLYERRDTPILCPVLNFLALAFADNAFRRPGISKPEDLFSFTIPHFKESLTIQWRPECMEPPVFCRQVNGVICDSTAWAYTDFNYGLKRLGFRAGYPQELTSYILRRGAANAVDCKAIPGEVKGDRYLLMQPRRRGYGSPEEPDNGSRKG